MNFEKYPENIASLIDSINERLGNDPKGTIAACEALESVGLLQEDSALIGYARFIDRKSVV